MSNRFIHLFRTGGKLAGHAYRTAAQDFGEIYETREYEAQSSERTRRIRVDIGRPVRLAAARGQDTWRCPVRLLTGDDELVKAVDGPTAFDALQLATHELVELLLARVVDVRQERLRQCGRTIELGHSGRTVR